MKEISTVERLHSDRRLKELKFQNQVGLLNELLDSNISCATEVIKDAYNDVKAVYRSVHSSIENHVLSLGSNKAAGEFNWIERIKALDRDMSVRYGERLDLLENKNNVPTSKNAFKLERMKLPTFSGDIKDYTKFKDDFNKYVTPEIEVEKTAYV